MKDTQGLAEAAGPTDPTPGHAVLLLRGMPVVLATRVAESFGMETREINQAALRNQEMFTGQHRFQLTPEEFEFLTSQGVIPKPGRGGSREMPWVYTQKGVIRLATIVNSAKARQATDIMIDLFIEVYQQLAMGRREIEVSQPGRLLPEAGLAGQMAKVRAQLFKAVADLLNTEIDPKSKTTVADEIGDLASSARGYIKAHLDAKGLENEKISAETVLVLEKAREVRAQIAKSAAETEGINLANFEKKLAIAERCLAMAEKLEPNAIVLLNRAFAKPSLLLQGPSVQEVLPAPENGDEES